MVDGALVNGRKVWLKSKPFTSQWVGKANREAQSFSRPRPCCLQRPPRRGGPTRRSRSSATLLSGKRHSCRFTGKAAILAALTGTTGVSPVATAAWKACRLSNVACPKTPVPPPAHLSPTVALQRDPPLGAAANQALKGFTAMMPQYNCPSLKSSVRMRSQPSRSAAATICAS